MLPGTFEYIGKIFPSTWGYLNMCKDSFSELSMTPFILITIAIVVIIILKIKGLEEDELTHCVSCFYK